LELPFILAKGPGDEIAIEYKASLHSVRITYRTDSGDLYRVVQNELGPEHLPAPENRLDPITTHRGLEIYGRDKSDGLAPWSAVWWAQHKLGDVEIASETLTMNALNKLAQSIIDTP
jgi:hypothetical protein